MDSKYVDILTGAIVYVVKFKYKDSLDPCYANSLVARYVKDIRDEDSNYHLNHYCMPLKEAKELMFKHIIRNNNLDNEYYGHLEKLEYVAIVELSNYEPHTEYQVIDYREFK